MKKEKALLALFDGKVIRGRDTELRISKGQLQERRLPKGSWENTSTGGWLWENFEIATDPVDFMTAWKDMLINRSKYRIKGFESEGVFYIDSLDGILMCTINGRSPYKASMSKKLIEGKWCKV